MDAERKTKVELEHRFLSRPGVRWWPLAYSGSCGEDKGMSSSHGEHWLAKKLFHAAGNADGASSVWDGWAGRTQTLFCLFSILLRYNRCTVKCTYLKCTVWWVDMYTPGKPITIIKIVNISIIPRSFLCNPPVLLASCPGSHWSVFCHYGLICIF